MVFLRGRVVDGRRSALASEKVVWGYSVSRGVMKSPGVRFGKPESGSCGRSRRPGIAFALAGHHAMRRRPAEAARQAGFGRSRAFAFARGWPGSRTAVFGQIRRAERAAESAG